MQVVDEKGTLIESFSENAGLGRTTLMGIDEPGNYTIAVRGRGKVAIAAIPGQWMQSKSYSGPVPPGWFAFLIPSFMWGDHTSMEISVESDTFISTSLFVLRDDLKPVPPGDEIDGKRHRVSLSDLDLFYYLVVFNGDPAPSQIIARITLGRRPPVDPLLTAAIILAIGAVLLLITLIRVRSRRGPKNRQ